MSDEIPIELLRELLDYDPETGALTWRPRPASMFKDGRSKTWNARFAGKPALNAKKGDGYLCGAINYINFQAHRVCWAFHYGKWPTNFIRHDNGNRSDNRITNLIEIVEGTYCRPSNGLKSVGDFFDHFSAWIVPISDSGCWIWIGTTTSSGYGEVKFRGRKGPAHRMAYMASKGDVPSDIMVRHACDIPCCVNPAHLSIGSQLENMADMCSRNRQSRGEHRPKAKLTSTDVIEIRRLIRLGASQSHIAEQFGVSQPRISKINTGKIWSHVK